MVVCVYVESCCCALFVSCLNNDKILFVPSLCHHHLSSTFYIKGICRSGVLCCRNRQHVSLLNSIQFYVALVTCIVVMVSVWGQLLHYYRTNNKGEVNKLNTQDKWFLQKNTQNEKGKNNKENKKFQVSQGEVH